MSSILDIRNIFFYSIFLFAFTGTLISIDIGFTLKPPQVFSILLTFICILDIIRKKVKINFLDYIPFLLFILTILPSFTSEKIFSDIYEPINSFRMLFNYLILQLMFFITTIYLNSKLKIKKALSYSLISYLGILAFGFYQQIGYYLDFYNPIDYLGFHSLFVDFYGPFLRISPATFANEFGEITQTVLIYVSTYFFIYYQKLSFIKKSFFSIFLLVLIITLIINFTRASWIVYFLYLISIFFVLKIKTSKRIIIITSIIFTSVIGYFINNETDFLNILLILDRLAEFTDLSQNSAYMRIITWEESYNLFLKNSYTILFGNGWGNAIDTHNVPLQLLAETGLSGFIGFYALIIYLIKKFYNNILLSKDDFFYFISISTFFSFLGCILFDFTNHGIYHFIFWFVIAIGFSINKLLSASLSNS